jgi:hypothetical protein
LLASPEVVKLRRVTKLALSVSGAFLMSLVACASRPAPPPETPATPVSVAKPPEEPDPEPTEEAPERASAPPPAELAKIKCERANDFSPVVLDAASYPNRRGATASRFSEVPTTKEEPLEACGVKGSLEALLRLRCDDGSNPFPSREAAHGSRSGNVGAGGRCGSIVDLYQVPCREQTYKVFIDMYMCPGASTAS